MLGCSFGNRWNQADFDLMMLKQVSDRTKVLSHDRHFNHRIIATHKFDRSRFDLLYSHKHRNQLCLVFPISFLPLEQHPSRLEILLPSLVSFYKISRSG
jgi:hypothetical protein